MQPATFQAVLVRGHKEDAVEVPFDPAERWPITSVALRPGRRGFPVAATLTGVAFESAIVARSNRFWLLVPGSVENAAGSSVGDLATITVAPKVP
jgi:hypothetical protein